MSTLPDVPTEPVEPLHVARQKVEIERTTKLSESYRKKLSRFNRELVAVQAEIDDSVSGSLTAAFRVLGGKGKDAVAHRARLRKRYLPIVVAAEQLARYASGLIENAQLPQLDKIELQLRNAELEAELIEARHLIG